MTTPNMNFAALQSTLSSGGQASQGISAACSRYEAGTAAPAARQGFRPMAANAS